jgi:hypothetical protein
MHCYADITSWYLLLSQDSCCEELLWGDELEYGIFCVDSVERTIKLSCRGAELLQVLGEKEKGSVHRCEGCTWHPEVSQLTALTVVLHR